MTTSTPLRRRWLTWGRLGWLVALALVIVLLVHRWIVGGQLRRAQALPAELEGKLAQVVRFEAERSLQQAQRVDAALRDHNWGAATLAVNDLRKTVDLALSAAPRDGERAVAEVAARLNELEQSIRNQSPDARDRLRDVTDALAPLAS